MYNSHFLFVIFLFYFLSSYDCTKEDVGIAYSACNIRTQHRDLVFYWKRECNVSSVNLPNPAFKENVTCDFGCASGNVFDSSVSCSTNLSECCVSCEPGKTADSGEVHITDWRNLPDTITSPNNMWRSDNSGFGMSTGILHQGDVARLDIDLDIITNSGSLRYEFIGFNTGEGSSLLLLYDDRLVVSMGLTGHRSSWLFFNLPYGKHKVSFEYHASLYQEPTVEGAHMIYAYEYGTTHMSSVCTECPAKMFSNNSAPCEYCAMNHYADVAGLSTCKECNITTQYAFPGSDQCSPRLNCTANDYQAHYTTCDSDHKMVQYFELSPYNICIETESSKPANQTIDCPKCNPGTKRGDNNTCVACPVGEYRDSPDSDDTQCTQCPAGTVTLKSLYFKNLELNVAGSPFRTSCEPRTTTSVHCVAGGNGWVSNRQSITSGNYYTGPVSTYLTTNITGGYGVTIEFRYRVHLESGSFFAYWAGYSQVPTSVNSSGNSDEWKKIEIPYNESSFTWSFHKWTQGYNARGLVSDYVEIDYIVFHGLNESTGGATSCRVCEAGSYSTAASTQCVQCEPGTYAAAGDPGCTTCPGETYAAAAGSDVCLPCGNSNVALRDHTGCEISTCGLTYNETHVFDLTPILSRLNADGNSANNDTMTGPVEIADWPISSFYIGVCQTDNSQNYCDNGNYSIQSLFCEISADGEGVYSVGSKTNITFFENTDTNEHGVNVTYYEGEFYNNYDYATFIGPRAAEVLFVCMPGAGAGKPQKPKTFINKTHQEFITQPHTYHFRWETEYACRLCLAADYTGIKGDCDGSLQTTTYVLNPNVKCTGGVTAPEITLTSCKLPLVTMNGGVLALIISGAVVVIIIVIVVLVVLVRANRKLKYQLFQKESLGRGGVSEGAGGAAAMVSFEKKN